MIRFFIAFMVVLCARSAFADSQAVEVVCDKNRYFGIFEHHVVIDSAVEKRPRDGAVVVFGKQDFQCNVGSYEVKAQIAPLLHKEKEKCGYGLGASFGLDINGQSIIKNSLFGPACFFDSINSIEVFDLSDRKEKSFALKICGSGRKPLPEYSACISVTDKHLSKIPIPLASPLAELLKIHLNGQL